MAPQQPCLNESPETNYVITILYISSSTGFRRSILYEPSTMAYDLVDGYQSGMAVITITGDEIQKTKFHDFKRSSTLQTFDAGGRNCPADT